VIEIIPAIDVRGGKCVRLFQGDYEKETVFSDDPVRMALRWESEGASFLHVVDLDAARNGDVENSDAIERICNSTKARVQVGGGIRTLDSAVEYVEKGIERVIIGTAAIESPKVVSSIIDSLGPQSVIVSVDARDGIVSIDGWTRESNVSAADLVKSVENMGVVRCLYTDISRDGTLTEPNYSAVEEIMTCTNMKVLVAGGISTIDSLLCLSDLGVEGAIVGRAIYTGDLKLSEVLNTIELC